MALRLTLIDRNYTRLWFGQAVSSVGDAVFSTTLVLWVAVVLAKGRPWAPAAVSGVMLAMGGAVLLVGPVAGVFVDRWSKRGTMLRTEVVRGALVTVLTAVSFLPVHALPAGVWLAVIYVTVFALNAAAQFFSPARFAVIGDLVTGEADRARAAGIAQATGQTAWLVGPPLAAPLLFTAGLQWALLFNALSYAVSYFAIRSAEMGPEVVRRGEPAGERAGLRREFVAGLRFFAGNRFLMALLALAVIGQCGVGSLNTLNVFFVTGNLHASAHLYGYLGMALGLGGIVGALCSGQVVQRIGARRTTWIGLLVSGVLLIAYARQAQLVSGIVLLFVFAVPLTMLNTAMSPLLLAAAPRGYTGRVMAVFYPATRLAQMLAALVAGWLASSGLRGFAGSAAGLRFGPIDTIFAVSGVLVVIAGACAGLTLPPPEAEPDPAPEAAPAARTLGGAR
ncbi:MFS transporter [Actinoallomurus iriomotensis]|uniref:MFS transporter n=1 Tax=Actinoallomurus iriomotensis TaxID=478107 RepID=A0A9W6VZD5_9ACTN|nr:MFS transporter [Actinoallomurus iriomotensis]GLY85239.1 MFS transporter [Actinoallomurus iriomotensis]